MQYWTDANQLAATIPLLYTREAKRKAASELLALLLVALRS